MNVNEILPLLNKKKRRIVARLLKKEATNVHFDGKYISLKFDGHGLKNKVVIQHHQPGVGDWSKKWHKVYVDDDALQDLTPKQFVCLLIHETVEKYVAQKYHLREDVEAHVIAETVEHKWTERHDVDWFDYDSLVTDLIAKKEMGIYNEEPQ